MARVTRLVTFPALCTAHALPAPVAEWRFHKTRRWRFDWAWPLHLCALEINGGLFIRGRHSRGASQVKDYEKWSTAAAMGWRVLHCQPSDLGKAPIMALLEQALKGTHQ